MAPITAKLVTQNIPSLFDLTKPTMLRAFKVLEDVIRGEILMDEPANPNFSMFHEQPMGRFIFDGQKIKFRG
jgi:hypothetical protein